MSLNISSTPQYLSYFARRRPDAAAVINGGTSVNYRTLATYLVQVTKELQDLSIKRDMLVGIQSSDRLLHLILILACEIIGAPTVSFSRTELNSNDRLLRLCDIIFLDTPHENLSGQRTYAMTPAWKDSIARRHIQSEDMTCLDGELDPEQIVRFNKTSGSTGQQKVMANSHRIQRIWIEKGISAVKNRKFVPLKYFCLYDLSMRAAHLRIRMALHTGGAVIFTNGPKFFRDCERFNEIYVYMLVREVQKLVNDVPPDFRRPSACYLQVVGGMLSPVLRTKAKQAFASEVSSHYSSNETGLISQIDENGVGALLPGVDAVIVDELDREKSYGEVGLIKLKADGMINGYFQDPELTAASFIDGWFRSSDVGYMPEPGKLVVLGRADDMLNIGGVKFSPNLIEEQIRHVEGIGDVALVSIANKNGVGEIAAEIEIKKSGDRKYIMERLQKILPGSFGQFHVIFTEALPRTETGKIQKRDVEARIRTALDDASTRSGAPAFAMPSLHSKSVR